MPINPNIILGVKPAQFQMSDPLETAGKSLSLQHLMGQQDMQAMQMKQARQAEADDAATREAYQSSGGNINKVLAALQGKGLYKPAQALQKYMLETEKSRGDINKTRAETMGKLFGFQKESAGAVMANPSPETALAAVDQFERMATSFGMPELSQQAAQQRAAIQAAGNNPDALKRLAAGWALTADKFLPEIQMINDGKITRAVDKNFLSNPNAGSTAIAMQTTPGEDLTDARSRELAAAARAQAAATRDQAAATREANAVTYDADRGMLINRATGEARPALQGGQPLGNKPIKPTEAYLKQQTGVENVRNAITEYRDALKGFDALDMLKPDSRAKMGTMYNNMMLQAKEAYNLGVLNGPDYQILRAVVADPNNFRTLATSKEALDTQAANLDRIMQKIGQTSAQVHGQPAPNVPRVEAPAAPNMPGIPKAGEVRKGYRFKGGDPAQQSSWEKV